MKFQNKSAFTIAELIITTVIMAIVCVIAPVIILKRSVKPAVAKKLNNIVECNIFDGKCLYDVHGSILRKKDGSQVEVHDYNKGSNEFYTIDLIGGGGGASSRSNGYPGESRTIYLMDLDNNREITNPNNESDRDKYTGILTGFLLMIPGKGGTSGRSGGASVICIVPNGDIDLNSATATCENVQGAIVIASAQGGITSNERAGNQATLLDPDIVYKKGTSIFGRGAQISAGGGGIIVIK